MAKPGPGRFPFICIRTIMLSDRPFPYNPFTSLHVLALWVHPSIKTIRSAVERRITLIDTAPAYGFGRSEEIVGKALAEGGLRDKVQIATKVGLGWKDEKVFRDSRPARIRREIEDSLRRLRTEFIDLYQVHWPDLDTPLGET